MTDHRVREQAGTRRLAKATNRTFILHVRLHPTDLEILNKLVAITGRTASDLVREGLRKVVADHEDAA